MDFNLSPEQGLVVVVGLLLGSLAVLLVYRARRGHQGRTSGSTDAAPEPTRSPLPSSQELAAIVGRDGFWVCLACHSLNRQEAKRCYACHAPVGTPGQPEPAAAPVKRAARVRTDGVARYRGVAEGTTVTPAPSVNDGPVPSKVAPEPVQASVIAAGPVGRQVPVCPFLGFRDDASTRCDFPDPRNLCHSTPTRGPRWFASHRRSIAGRPGATRPKTISAQHQRSTCLSPTHEQCERYPAIPVAAASG